MASKRLRLDLLPAKADEVMAALAEHDESPALRWLHQQLGDVMGRAEKKRAPRPLKPKVKRSGPSWRRLDDQGWMTKELRQVVWERSEDRCECGCGRAITWTTFELDHYVGRARAAQTPENTWALATDCHRAKHAARPSREHWLNAFLVHLKAHGFGKSATAEKVRAELEGEELIEQARAIRARQETNHG